MSFTVDRLNFSYTNENLLKEITFDIKQHEIFCILGPSGCGKTTLLKLLSGLLTPLTGTIGQSFFHEKSFLFQEPRLLPQRTVYENLKITAAHRFSPADLETAIDHYLTEVRLAEFKHHYPDELSGGMQQRVAIVRAFLNPAELMFLDEPFKSLDVEIKLSVMEVFKSLWTESPKTVLMITHDVLAAALLGDRVMILSEKPTQVVEILDNPVSRLERTVYNAETALFQSKLYTYFMPKQTQP